VVDDGVFVTNAIYPSLRNCAVVNPSAKLPY